MHKYKIILLSFVRLRLVLSNFISSGHEASVAARSYMSYFRTFLNSPVGPKTTHFWGPVANWGFVAAAMADIEKPPEMLSGNMTGVMCVYSALCMRFAWMVRPRNYLLLVCHASNETVQLYQLSRWARGQGYLQLKEDTTPST